MWFWQYRVKVISMNQKSKIKTVAGVIVGETIVEAVQSLYNYYGEELIDILSCKPIMQMVFEFDTARSEGFDYTFVYEPKEEN